MAAWRWGLLSAAALAGLALLVLAAAQREPRALREDAAARAARARWLRGLTRLQGVDYAEYRAGAPPWRLSAALGRVEGRRMVFGYLPATRVLRLVAPQVSIPHPTDPVHLRARLGYYEQRERRWVFVDGDLTRGGRRERFRQLAWYPAQRRLERSRTAGLPPVLRFWEPRY